ncbi:MAG TPA: type II toxin-antitoxin system PemK/MazF family toxin [Chloroflexota bacterium]|nr:type II toxin-antitoxin system PemK/MazF family toxin [Chloroflexota bacterium]
MLRKVFEAGSIYYIPDVRLRLPGDIDSRTHHPQRPVLIVSDQNARHGTNAQPSQLWPSVLIVPLSSSTTGRTKFDVRLGAGEGNLPKKSWARVPALQVVDKDYIGDYLGKVTPAVLEMVNAQILNYLGLIDPEGDEPEVGSEPDPEGGGSRPN